MKSTALCLGLLCIALPITVLFARRDVKNGETYSARSDSPSGAPVIPAIVRALRPNYPYSVIPGGVYSPEELRRATETDPAVRDHYSGFNLKRARLVVAARETFQFTSYRLNGKIYWTKRRLRIPKGEILMSDGMNLARTRCGNRLSQSTIPEVAKIEPSFKELSLPPFSMDLLRNGALTLAQLSTSDSIKLPMRPLLATTPAEVIPEDTWPLVPAFLPVNVAFPGELIASNRRASGSATATTPAKVYSPSPPIEVSPTPPPRVAEVPEPGLLPAFLILLAGSSIALCRMKRLPPLTEKYREIQTEVDSDKRRL